MYMQDAADVEFAPPQLSLVAPESVCETIPAGCAGVEDRAERVSVLLDRRHKVTRIFHRPLPKKALLVLASRGFWNACAASHMLK